MVRRTIRTGPRPRYAWAPGYDFNNAGATSGLNQSTDLLNSYVTDAQRETGPGMVIERILGSFTVASQVVGVGGAFTLGLIVSPEGGHTTPPLPQTEIADWLVWLSGEIPQTSIESSAAAFTPLMKTYTFDVRVRRRLRAMGDEVRAVVENSEEAPTWLWTIQTRILLRVT